MANSNLENQHASKLRLKGWCANDMTGFDLSQKNQHKIALTKGEICLQNFKEEGRATSITAHMSSAKQNQSKQNFLNLINIILIDVTRVINMKQTWAIRKTENK